MPQGLGSPGAPATGPQSPPGPPGAGAQPEDPRAILQAVSGHPTDFPQSPLAPQATQPTSQSLAFKVDALRRLSSMPWAGPEITTMLKQATNEWQQQAAQNRPLPPGP